MRNWNELSMAERADVMRLAIDGGVYDLDSIRSGYNEYAKGGKIHIDPSKKGTFTAAASKHGMGVQQFASKVLAHPENYSPAMRKKANFARNAAKWKHGLGGNLFGGTTENSQQMQMGLKATNSWKPYTLNDILANAARIEQQKQTMEDRFRSDLVLSNDATSTANGRPQNRHLERKAIEGAKAHRAWEKEHPILNTVGLGLSTIPLVAAASPILAPAGEAFAGTTLAGISAPMWADAALTAGFGAHGLNHAINEDIDGWGDAAMTALEVAPLGRLAKPIFNETAMAIENYRYPLGRPQVPEGYLTVKPQVRTKVGDVEIDNPQLFYRQGSAEMGDDFIKSGVVRTSGGFENPMYTEGALFKKVPTRTKGGLSKGDRIALEGPYNKTKSDLLVTDSSVDMIPADQGSGKNYTWFEDYISDLFAEESIFDKSRVPLFDGTATSANTTAYRWEPGYGYRRILAEDTPTINWVKAQKAEPFQFTEYKESPFQMHLKRAKAKGYDVSDIKVIDLTKDSPERTEYINNSGLVGSFEEKLQMLIDRINKGGGAGNPKGTRYILHTNPDNLDARLSHELNHLLHIPDEPVPKGTVYGGWMNIFGDYFKRFNNTDIAARLSQIRDYYGQTEKEPLTEPMLKYAREHYENDTGLKNSVQEMLRNTGDLKGLAEWGNKHATGLLPFGLIGPYYLNNE